MYIYINPQDVSILDIHEMREIKFRFPLVVCLLACLLVAWIKNSETHQSKIFRRSKKAGRALSCTHPVLKIGKKSICSNEYKNMLNKVLHIDFILILFPTLSQKNLYLEMHRSIISEYRVQTHIGLYSDSCWYIQSLQVSVLGNAFILPI